jgi:hypothetical protein
MQGGGEVSVVVCCCGHVVPQDGPLIVAAVLAGHVFVLPCSLCRAPERVLGPCLAGWLGIAGLDVVCSVSCHKLFCSLCSGDTLTAELCRVDGLKSSCRGLPS